MLPAWRHVLVLVHRLALVRKVEAGGRTQHQRPEVLQQAALGRLHTRAAQEELLIPAQVQDRAVEVLAVRTAEAQMVVLLQLETLVVAAAAGAAAVRQEVPAVAALVALAVITQAVREEALPVPREPMVAAAAVQARAVLVARVARASNGTLHMVPAAAEEEEREALLQTQKLPVMEGHMAAVAVAVLLPTIF
jgi:hypothetical protein